MEIVALVLAIISFALCFIVWVIPFLGPFLVVALSILAIIFSIVALISINGFNKKNIYTANFLPKKNTKSIISLIVGMVSLLIAVLFLILHLFIFITFSPYSYEDGNYIFPSEEVSKNTTEIEYGTAYEIEDDVLLTIESAIFDEGTLNIEYSISNKSSKESVIYLNNFYYQTSDNVDEKVYPYKNTMMPIYIEPNAVYVSEVISIDMEHEPTIIGYDSISAESIIINVE